MLRRATGFVEPPSAVGKPEKLAGRLFSVEENLLYHAAIALPDKTALERSWRVRDLLERLSFNKANNLLWGEQKGWERMRINLAIEMLPAPPLLFLHEPFEELAGVEQAMATKLLSDLATIDGHSRVLKVAPWTLHTLEEQRSCLAPFQGRQHGCEAGRKSPTYLLSPPRHTVLSTSMSKECPPSQRLSLLSEAGMLPQGWSGNADSAAFNTQVHE